MILHAEKWKYLVFIRSEEIFKCFYASAVFFNTTSSEDSHTLLEFMWKNTAGMNSTCGRNDNLSALYRKKMH